ncbi:PP2C family protein-serine/threonine phosphatase [Frankia gtarii]|uniref:PP2C family protein-serine/threonine phosphatase n=1 Tax=Frankia gtarii TaxID=2950102 RepID=UPI0021BED79D|nr:PP2C family protein-serine/threonine phosphatase [Frankia gtarii]
MGAYWRLHAATPGASGDWVDVFDLDDGRFAVCVGDAAGHGSQAAAFAGRVRAVLRRRLLAGAQPEAAVSGTVDEVAGLGDLGEMFATAFVAVADPSTGRVVYVNAGHPPAVHLARSGADTDVEAPGAQSTPAGLPLGPTGPILSDLFAGTSIWSSRSLRMAPGDRVVVYTDGISEARDAAGELFGTGRIGSVVGADISDIPPDLLIDRLLARVAAHTHAEARDDRTVAVLARQFGPPAAISPIAESPARHSS